jgi:hypothetical protein
MNIKGFSLTLCTLLCAQAATSATFDATTSFQTASNPNGVWSYGYSLAGEPAYSFTPFANVGSGPLGPYWHQASLGVFPLVSKNQTANALENVQPGQLYLHAGPTPFGDLAILRFTAPTADTYVVGGQFFAGAPGAQSGAVYANGLLLQAFGVTTDSSVFSFSPVSLPVGGTIDFVVGNNGNFLFGATPLSVVISPIPEPMSAALFVLGCVAFASLRARNSRMPIASAA